MLSARVVDITTLATDAIVNAANEQLSPGGGVCGAIHRAAGPELARACAALGHCPTGEARLTPGFRLPARFVIHAVGPVWRGGAQGEAGLLASAYAAAMRLAREHGLRSIGFPAISTGIYGYPLAAATGIAVRTVREALAESPGLEQVVFACFSPAVLEEYRHAMTQPDERLRPHPSTRLAGPVVPLNLPDLARALQAEPHPAKGGHRQAGLIHRGPLRLLLFAFEPGGHLPEHRAPGHVVIHCLRGELAVEAGDGRHRLADGEALLLDPNVPHAVEAITESEMLLTVCVG
jgi:O-acetyl-ADP-ribose deacetylase (regulator of RNase III)/quercetin dioxygenase-like cupin family protein